jgi:hypothetical protein
MLWKEPPMTSSTRTRYTNAARHLADLATRNADQLAAAAALFTCGTARGLAVAEVVAWRQFAAIAMGDVVLATESIPRIPTVAEAVAQGEADEEPCLCGTPFTCMAVHHDEETS